LQFCGCGWAGPALGQKKKQDTAKLGHQAGSLLSIARKTQKVCPFHTKVTQTGNVFEAKKGFKFEAMFWHRLLKNRRVRTIF